MRFLTDEEENQFLTKHEGKVMRFSNYYKYKFYYKFTDEDGQEFTLIMGDGDGDIYRDKWKAEETISPHVRWGFHGIMKPDSK